VTDTSPVEWLALTHEEPVDPKRRIIDPHHHLWHEADALGGGPPQYLVEDLLRDTRSGHNVTDTVFIECGASYRKDGRTVLRPVGETEFAARQVAASASTETRVAGIVGFADMTLGDEIEEVLDGHEAAGQRWFKGIRHVVASDPALPARGGDSRRPGVMAEKGFRRALFRLGERGYSFDALVFHPQLAELAEAARATPNTTFVLNHLGVPLGLGPYTDRDQVRSVWQDGMRQLGSCPNVVVKVSGIGMDALFGTGWSSRPRPPTSDEVLEWWGDDIRWCIDHFGPSRCMFASNFPVDRRGIGYSVLWNVFQKVSGSYSSEEQDALFIGTAARAYRIDARSS
jgi:L-fuconolactonase